MVEPAVECLKITDVNLCVLQKLFCYSKILSFFQVQGALHNVEIKHVPQQEAGLNVRAHPDTVFHSRINYTEHLK